MDKENAELACQIQSQQNWEAPSETNMISSQTDVSFIVAVLGSVCVCVSVFKQVNEFLEPVPQSWEHRQYQWV